MFVKSYIIFEREENDEILLVQKYHDDLKSMGEFLVGLLKGKSIDCENNNNNNIDSFDSIDNLIGYVLYELNKLPGLMKVHPGGTSRPSNIFETCCTSRTFKEYQYYISASYKQNQVTIKRYEPGECEGKYGWITLLLQGYKMPFTITDEERKKIVEKYPDAYVQINVNNDNGSSEYVIHGIDNVNIVSKLTGLPMIFD